MHKNKKGDYVTIEYGRVFIHSGLSKIDATMAFKIGLAVGSKSIEGIEYLKIEK